MRHLALCLAALLLAAAAPASAPPSRYGTLHLRPPVGEMRGFVILFSSGPAWQPADDDTAAALTRAGAYVAGVARGPYLAGLSADPAQCHLMDGDAETLARQIERELGGGRFFRPILAGIGGGGALARRVLALAPPNTMAGAVAVDPAEDDAIAALPCGRGATTFNGTWSSATHPAAASAEALAALAAPMLPALGQAGSTLSDLPLVPMKGDTSNGMLAIVVAGDGGWRDIDKTIADNLHREGVSVVGLDSLRYFWGARTPDRTATDLARIVSHYADLWQARHIALIGYSFGADVLPFAYTRLPAGLRDRIELLSLLSVSKGADFEIRVVGWLGAPPSASALPTLPELARIPPARLQCIYGSSDAADSACPALAGTGAQVVRIQGGHHFDGDYPALTRRILDAWRRAAN